MLIRARQFISRNPRTVMALGSIPGAVKYFSMQHAAAFGEEEKKSAISEYWVFMWLLPMMSLLSELFQSGKDTGEEVLPIAGALTLGGVTGYCTGKAVRVFGQGASIVFGITFIALQGAAYCGFVTVHWDKIQQAVIQQADMDGNGRIDEKDLQEWTKKGETVLTHDFSLKGGFGAGFLAGIRR
uniref:EF-hand domain-containing protein n=1 Tax=Lotharella globosa TaxID=91324 RepID=A0A7S4DJC9_9EUKA